MNKSTFQFTFNPNIEIVFTKIFREIDFTEIAKDEKSKIKTWRTQIFSFYADYKTVF